MIFRANYLSRAMRLGLIAMAGSILMQILAALLGLLVAGSSGRLVTPAAFAAGRADAPLESGTPARAPGGVNTTGLAIDPSVDSVAQKVIARGHAGVESWVIDTVELRGRDGTPMRAGAILADDENDCREFIETLRVVEIDTGVPGTTKASCLLYAPRPPGERPARGQRVFDKNGRLLLPVYPGLLIDSFTPGDTLNRED